MLATELHVLLESKETPDGPLPSRERDVTFRLKQLALILNQ